MTLALTPEHLELAESVRGWVGRACPPEQVAAAANSPDAGSAAYRADLAPALAAQGLLGLHLPEADGGQGFGVAELCVAAEELGRALLPGGYAPTVLASAAVSAAGLSGKLLTALGDGSRTGALSLSGTLTGQNEPDGTLVIDGDAGVVLGAGAADVVVLPARTADGEVWVAADASALEITAVPSLDLTRPLARVAARMVPVPQDRQIQGLSRATVTGLAAAILGAEACGIADWAVHTAAEYAKVREQFGRPIGAFQAVKHRCASMLARAEQAAATVWDAARAAAEPASPESELAAATALVIAVDAAVSCAHDCIQTLGGIGYTWEHPAHRYYRRALSLRAVLGRSARWREEAAGLALGGTSRSVRLDIGDDDADRARIRAELAEIALLSGKDQRAALADGGWVLPHLPRPWGRGASAVEQLVIDQELRGARISVPGLAIGAWVVPALIQHGSAEQRQRFLPATLRLDYLWCQLFSEPGAGSDLASLTTRAVHADGGWRITGQKIWTSLAREAAWAICLARTDPAAAKHDGITYFLLDMHSPGVDVRPLREITGESVFNEVFLDDVLVPDDCVVGEVNGGWRVARTTLANERVSLARSWTFGCGVPELLAVTRVADDAPLAEVGALVCAAQSIDLLGLRAAAKQLSGTDPGATGSVRKLLSMRHAQEVAELCWAMSAESGSVVAERGALSGSGSSPVTDDGKPDGAHWARQVLMSRALTIGGGTTDVQLNIIAERMLGLPRDTE